jgi:hypothetical protein
MPSLSELVCELRNGVGVIRRYSNRSDLLERLRKMAAILSDGGPYDRAGVDAEVNTTSVIRSRRLRDRFSRDDLQAMIDLYRAGTTARRAEDGVLSALAGRCWWCGSEGCRGRRLHRGKTERVHGAHRRGSL